MEHPKLPNVFYFANEQGNTVTHATNGRGAADDNDATPGPFLSAVSSVSSVPEEYPGPDYPLLGGDYCTGGCSHLSEIKAHPSGSTIYTCNRGSAQTFSPCRFWSSLDHSSCSCSRPFALSLC